MNTNQTPDVSSGVRLNKDGTPRSKPGPKPGTKIPALECKRGHQMAGDNLYVNSDGRKKCRACRTIGMKAWREKNHAQACAREKVWRDANKEHLKAKNKENYWKNLEKNRAYKRKKYANDPEGVKQRVAQWRLEHPGYARRYDFAKKYGVDFDYDALWNKQGGLCAIPACGNDGTETKKGMLYVDHCHDTGVVRGLLCAGCNSALGHAKEDPKRLVELAAYAERWSAAKAAR